RHIFPRSPCHLVALTPPPPMTTTATPGRTRGFDPRHGGRSRAHAAAPTRRPQRRARLGLSPAGGPAHPRRRRRPPALPVGPLPARLGARRGPLLGLVAPPRLELLQQGAARRLAHPGEL